MTRASWWNTIHSFFPIHTGLSVVAQSLSVIHDEYISNIIDLFLSEEGAATRNGRQ